MTSKQRKKIENEFYNYEANQNPLWKTVFERTLIVCESERCEGKQYDELIKMLYLEHKKPYIIWASLDISEDDFYKKKRAIKKIAFKEAKRLKVL